MASRQRPLASRYDAAASDDESDFSDASTLPKTSAEIAQFDRDTLERENEQERLLIRAAGTQSQRYTDKPEPRKQRRKKHATNDNEKHLMYEAKMEEGGSADSVSDISEDSSERDREKIGAVQTRKKRTWRRTCIYVLVWVLIGILFIGIAFGALRASHSTAPFSPAASLLSNGTAVFAPTTILISLDGFRADYLNRGLTPTLNDFIKDGVSPRYMVPSFPSVTFPNHFTLVTGLYPESHGVVGNTFWDPNLGEEFFYTHPESSMQAKWWTAEPIWVTAEHQGVRTAIHMWPGSEAHLGDVEPTFLDKYNGSEVLSAKVARVLGLLDLPGLESETPQRPQLIAAYVPNVDAAGHRYGPNSTEINDSIKAEDDMLAQLFDGLRKRNLTEVVNVVVVSDHGMATTSAHRVIQLDDMMNVDDIEHMEGWPHYGIRVKDGVDLEATYDGLAEHASHHDGFDVYLRDRNMPEEFHFTNNERIAPLWLIAKTSWVIATKEEFNVEAALESGEEYQPKGVHGYDHQHPLMRAMFVAHGPAFPHPSGSRLEEFQNTNVYNIICDSVGVHPLSNNGSIRLPFKPVGLHSDPDVETGAYNPPLESWRLPQTTISNATAASTGTVGSVMASSTIVGNASISRPVIEHVDDDGGEDGGVKTIWIDVGDWFGTQWGRIQGWLQDIVNQAKQKPDEKEGEINGDEGQTSKEQATPDVSNGDDDVVGSATSVQDDGNDKGDGEKPVQGMADTKADSDRGS